jgi:hypothetical protein
MVLFQKSGNLALHLGPDIPPKYGGTGSSLADSHCLGRLQPDLEDQKDNQEIPDMEEE